MTHALFEKLERSFCDRSLDAELKRRAWDETAMAFPPAPVTPGTDGFPSTLISLRAGDLGLALLWIVQSVLVRSLSSDSGLPEEARRRLDSILSPADARRIGALAHSEPADEPVILREHGGTITVSGTKKYITGGAMSDFILLTARHEGEDKISRLVCLPTSMVPVSALTELDLKALATTSHARLDLRDFTLPSGFLVPVDGQTIRRLIRKWGIIERALILEAYIALGVYVHDRLRDIIRVDASSGAALRELLDEQKGITLSQIAEARSGSMISPKSADIKALLGGIKLLQNTMAREARALPADLLARQADLDLFNMLKM